MPSVPRPAEAASPGALIALDQSRAVLYDRVSTVNQSKVGYSGGADGFQIKDCQARAVSSGLRVVGMFSDVDSGAKWEMAGIMEVLERARRREYDVLIVANSGRFARNLAKRLVYEAELRKHGVQVLYLNIGLQADNSPTGRAMTNMVGVFDEYERELIGHRTFQGRREKAQRGKVVGAGPAPYGYVYATEWSEPRKRDVPVGLQVDSETSRVVERIYRDIRRQSTADIAATLSDEGVAPPAAWEPSAKRPRSGRWSKSTVRRIVTSSVYRGEWHFGDIPVVVPPIVDEATWAATQRLAVERRPSRRGCDTERSAAWLLRGRMTCGHCGGAISTNSNAVGGPSAVLWPNGHQRRYACARSTPSRAKLYGWELCGLPGLLAADEREMTTGGTSRPLGGIEELAWAAVTRFLSDESLVATMLAEVDAEQAQARDQWAGRLLTLDEQIKVYSGRLRRAVEEKQKIEDDDDRYAAWDDAERKASAVLKQLRAERAEYMAPGAPGLTDEHRAAIVAMREQISELLAEGAEEATPEERRAVFELLDLRGTVREDAEHGLRVGRDARVVIRWQLLQSDSGFLKLGLIHSSSGVTLTTLSSGHDDMEETA